MSPTTPLFGLARVVGNQNEHFGAWFSRQNHVDSVARLHSDRRLGIRRMVRGSNTLAIQKHLEAAYFVLAWSIPVADGQNTATLRYGVDAKIPRPSAWLVGGTCLEELHIYAWRMTREILRRVTRNAFALRRRSFP